MDWNAIGVICGLMAMGVGFSTWLHKIYRLADQALTEIKHLTGLLEKLELANKDDHVHLWEALHEHQRAIQDQDRRITRLEPRAT